MRLSDLQSKNLVNVIDGKNIGNIVDVRINSKSGEIASLIVEEKNSPFSLFNKDNEIEVYWNNIKKIGEDVILVDFK